MDMSVVHGSVVVGVDGSEASTAAVDWAVRFAARESRRLAVVHACGLPGNIADFDDVVANERGLMSVGRTLAREAEGGARLLAPEVAVTTVVAWGGAGNLLVEASETAAVLVVGARGRGAVASVLLGSVSGQVARESHCPTVVVREWSERDRGPVVVGVDGTAASTGAVEFAFHQASVNAVPLKVLHAGRSLTCLRRWST